MPADLSFVTSSTARGASISRFCSVWGSYTLGALIRYLVHLSTGRLILWCYFIWYLVVLVSYFDPNPRLWLTSLGLSGIIGVALYLSTTAGSETPVRLGRWPTIRLFLMPFCVSSFAALVKGQDFILIFSPDPAEIAIAVGLCALLCALTLALKREAKRRSDLSQPTRGAARAKALTKGP